MTWNKWVLALLGLVVVAVPFLNLDAVTNVWTSVIVGLAIIGLSILGVVGDTDVESTGARYQHNS